MCPAPVRGNAEFPKPTAQDAIDVAIATFEAGERVDMAQIAQRLGVGRSTLYRWVGDREALMDRVIDATTLKLAASVQRRVRGKGLDRVCSAVRVYLEATTRYEPLRSLAEREPALALHVVMNPDGVFATNTREGLRAQLQRDLPDVSVPDDVIEVLNATNLAVVWASIAGGYDPHIERPLAVLRTVIGAHMA
jgi:AcrR family transcriptional regulator